MQRALAELRIEGIKTTVPLHREDPRATRRSSKAAIDTTFVERSGLSTIDEVAGMLRPRNVAATDSAHCLELRSTLPPTAADCSS